MFAFEGTFWIAPTRKHKSHESTVRHTARSTCIAVNQRRQSEAYQRSRRRDRSAWKFQLSVCTKTQSIYANWSYPANVSAHFWTVFNASIQKSPLHCNVYCKIREGQRASKWKSNKRCNRSRRCQIIYALSPLVGLSSNLFHWFSVVEKNTNKRTEISVIVHVRRARSNTRNALRRIAGEKLNMVQSHHSRIPLWQRGAKKLRITLSGPVRINFLQTRLRREMNCSSRQLTPVPSAFTGIWLIKLDASKGGFAGGGAVVGGAGVVIGSSEPSWGRTDRKRDSTLADRWARE